MLSEYHLGTPEVPLPILHRDTLVCIGPVLEVPIGKELPHKIRTRNKGGERRNGRGSQSKGS